MRTRNIVNGNVVWFGSIGVDSNGKKIPAENFAENANSVVASLTQQLSVLKYELWYNNNYGIPIVDKVKSKAQLDAYVGSIITQNKDVVKIEKFVSNLKDSQYTCNVKILTTFGETEFTI